MMRLTFTAAGCFALAITALASTPIRATLDQLASGADHILIGRVVGVDMVDSRCRVITDPEARTGPGLTNVIRLHISVDEVLVTSAKSVPKVLKVPLDPFLHYDLGQIQEAYPEPSGPRLVLLEGSSFQPIIPGAFLRNVSEQKEALRIHGISTRAPRGNPPAPRHSGRRGTKKVRTCA